MFQVRKKICYNVAIQDQPKLTKSLFKINFQLLSATSSTTISPSNMSSFITDAMPFLRVIPTADSMAFRGWIRKLLNYLKQLPGSKIDVIFDIHSNAGNKNCLSKWRTTPSQECMIEDLIQKDPYW